MDIFLHFGHAGAALLSLRSAFYAAAGITVGVLAVYPRVMSPSSWKALRERARLCRSAK
jgi:hypothetical protein